MSIKKERRCLIKDRKGEKSGQGLAHGEQGSLLEVGSGSTGCNSSTLCCWFSKKSDRSCKLFFFGSTVILGSNGSIPWYSRDEKAVGNQEGLHQVILGDSLTYYFVVRLNVFLECQTHLIQPELLVGDAAGLEFGE